MNKKTKICLNAMVGNESKTITRMLESVAPHIDYYVIQCNGKEDNTREVIDNFFTENGIPGFTYFIEWDFPGANRDHTLQEALKAEHGCDWILRMDADERLQVDETFDWSLLDDTSVDSYNITAQAGDTKYFRTWFWNAKLPWFFQHDKRHETIHLPNRGEDFQRYNMPYGFRHLVGQDGETWLVPRKFLNDALELEKDKVVATTTNDDEYVVLIPPNYQGKNVHVLFGGSHTSGYSKNSFKTEAIQKYGNILKPYATNTIIVVTHHMNTVSNVQKYVSEKYGANVTSLAGFSQGGKEAWRHASDGSFKLVGLIDPSTYQTDVQFGSGTYLYCDPKNWGTTGFYGETRRKLEWYCENKEKYSGRVTCFNKGGWHMNFGILKSFYDTYGSMI